MSILLYFGRNMFDEIPYGKIAFDKSVYKVAGFLYYIHDSRNKIHNFMFMFMFSYGFWSHILGLW